LELFLFNASSPRQPSASLTDACLACGIELVAFPDVIITVGVVVLQVQEYVALSTVAREDVVIRTIGNADPGAAVHVGCVGMNLVAGSVVVKDDPATSITVGRVVDHAIMAAAEDVNPTGPIVAADGNR
jgi:hypothetical protein